MKQRIDHSNYEAWLLDRSEGNLSAVQEAELSAFLLLHPHLDPGHEELPTIKEAVAKLGALDKEALKRRLPPVAKVDAGNIDDHLVARLENDLTREQLDALSGFLVRHSEHQRAERMYAQTKLVPEAMAFAAKRDTHRAIPPQGLPTRFTLDDFLVARLEGDLTQEQEEALASYIVQDSTAQRAWLLMQATRVRASGIVFADRDALKKGGRVIAITRASWVAKLAAAASIALLIGVAWWWMRGDEQAPQVAQEENSPSPGAQQIAGSTLEEVTNPKEQPVDPGEGGIVAPENVPELVRGEQQQKQEESPQLVPPSQLPEAPIAEQVRPQQEETPNSPGTPIEHQPIAPDPGPLAMTTTMRANTPVEVRTVGQALTGALRERMLEQEGDPRPLDGADAVAAVDRGLKAVAGDRSGFNVPRDAAGRGRGFALRLGRNLAITASR